MYEQAPRIDQPSSWSTSPSFGWHWPRSAVCSPWQNPLVQAMWLCQLREENHGREDTKLTCELWSLAIPPSEHIRSTILAGSHGIIRSRRFRHFELHAVEGLRKVHTFFPDVARWEWLVGEEVPWSFGNVNLVCCGAAFVVFVEAEDELRRW